jgi:SAM-dependent methyltransferase
LLHCEAHVGVELAITLNGLQGVDVIYDGYSLPFADGCFESALCTEVLEHTRDPAQVLCEVARVLRPGGHVLVTVPMIIHDHEEPRDYYRFTRYGLLLLAEGAGLEPVWIEPRGGAWTAAVCAADTAASALRRPVVDVVRWLLWPAATIARRVDRRRGKQPVFTLGWQGLFRRVPARRRE